MISSRLERVWVPARTLLAGQIRSNLSVTRNLLDGRISVMQFDTVVRLEILDELLFLLQLSLFEGVRQSIVVLPPTRLCAGHEHIGVGLKHRIANVFQGLPFGHIFRRVIVVRLFWVLRVYSFAWILPSFQLPSVLFIYYLIIVYVVQRLWLRLRIVVLKVLQLLRKNLLMEVSKRLLRSISEQTNSGDAPFVRFDHHANAVSLVNKNCLRCFQHVFIVRLPVF